MSDSNDYDLGGNSDFSRSIVRLSQQRDQSTALMRDDYLRLDEQSRSVFREWVNRLAAAGGVPVGLGVNVWVKVHLEVPSTVREIESVEVTPQTLSKAVE